MAELIDCEFDFHERTCFSLGVQREQFQVNNCLIWVRSVGNQVDKASECI